MDDFGEFLLRLGNLHDCTITRLEWKAAEKRIDFEIEDIYFNFEGLPEYKGPTPGLITLAETQSVAIELHAADGPLRVYEFSAIKEASGTLAVSISLWPSGKISVRHRRAIFPVIALPKG